MLESAWLFIGVVAMLATGVAVSTKTKVAGAYPNDDGIAIFSGVISFISWGMVAYGALNIEVITETGEIVSYSMSSVTYFAIALALVPAYIALTGPVDIVRRARNPDAKDV